MIHHCDHDNRPRPYYEFQRLLFVERHGVYIYWHNYLDFIKSVPELPIEVNGKFIH